MKTLHRNYLVLASLFALMLVAIPTFAMPPGGPGYGPGGGDPETMQARMEARMEKMAVLLDLTAEQQEQLKTFKTEHRAEMATSREEMRALKKGIGEELEKPELDMARIYQLQADLKTLLAKKADHRLEGILGARKILSPNQFTKFMVLTKDHRRGKGGHGRGMGRGMGMGPCPTPATDVE